MKNKSLTLEKGIFLFVFFFGIFVSVLVLWQTISAPSGKKSAPAFLFFEMLIGILIIFVPSFFSQITKIKIPGMIKIFYWIFLLFAVFLGTGLHVINTVYYWDKLLHISSSMLLVAIGYGLIGYFLPKEIGKQINPLFFFIFGAFFGLACGVLWEFYEFTCDGLLGMNLQRFARDGKDLVGRAALMDTMGDLLIDALGSFLFSFFCYFKAKKNPSFYWNFAFQKKGTQKGEAKKNLL